MQGGAPAADDQLRGIVQAVDGRQRPGDQLVFLVSKQGFADQVFPLADAQQELEVWRQRIHGHPQRLGNLIAPGLSLHHEGQLVDGYGAIGTEAQAALDLERRPPRLGRDADCIPDQTLDQAGGGLGIEGDGEELFPVRALFLQPGDWVLGALQGIGLADVQHRLDQAVEQFVDRRLLVAGGQKLGLGLDGLAQTLILQAVFQCLLSDHA